MFHSSFEKTAFVEKAMQGLKQVAKSFTSHFGASGIAKKNAAKEIQKLKKANVGRELQGKKIFNIDEQKIHQKHRAKIGEELENKALGKNKSTADVQKQNFIQKHPYISLAGGMYAAHKLTQPSAGPEVQRPELGY